MRRSVRGFTLLEVLVAFALLAVALTLLIGTLSGAASQVSEADVRSRAVLHARTLLDRTGVDAPLQEGEQRGQWENGRYRWQMQVAAWSEPRSQDAPVPAQQQPAGPRLLEVRLQVSWSEAERDRLQWRTLRLVPPTLEGR